MNNASPRLLGNAIPVALGVGGAGLGATAWAVAVHPAQAWPGYLCAWIFWLGISLGSLLWLMVHRLMRAGWGRAMQRPAEAAAGNLLLLALLFIPLALGLRWLYPWMDHDLVRQISVLSHRATYMSAPFFLIRAAFLLALWCVLAARYRALSAPGIMIYFVTMTIASMDWLMSQDVYFYSTIFGFLITTQQGLAACAFLILALCLLVRYQPLRDHVTPEIFNDLGALLETSLILWAYMMFSQFLVLWMGNIQDDVGWWVRRLSGPWVYVTTAMLVLQFFVPFILLLMRRIKRSPRALASVAALLLFMTLVDSWWIVAPSRLHAQSPLQDLWPCLTATLGIGGIWFALFLRRLQQIGCHPRKRLTEATMRRPGHETSDANPRALLIALIGLAISGVLVFAVVWVTLRYLQPRVTPELSAAPPPEPRLQPSPGHPTLPAQDLQTLRLQEQTLLTQYAWVDRDAHIARIPIARAEDILIARGLPPAWPATRPSSGGTP